MPLKSEVDSDKEKEVEPDVPTSSIYTSSGGVIPTLADLTYKEKNVTPPAA